MRLRPLPMVLLFHFLAVFLIFQRVNGFHVVPLSGHRAVRSTLSQGNRQQLRTTTTIPTNSNFLKASAVEAQETSSSNVINSRGGQILEILESTSVLDPVSDRQCPALSPKQQNNKNKNNNFNFFGNLFGNSNGGNDKKEERDLVMVVVMPQLGDFDSAEYAEHLSAILPDLKQAGITLRIIGVGDAESAFRFCQFNKIPQDIVCVDGTANLHQALNLHRGPNWDIPSWIPDGILEWFADYTGALESKIPATTPDEQREVARAWLNYMAMCAGISAPDTLPEILRGYFGDKNAPERIRPDEVVTVGDNLIVVKGVTDVKLGPIEYQSLWKNAAGYQRPAELATARLKVMVEVLTKFKEYVPDQRYLDWRGATFLLDRNSKELLYENRDTGVLAYSKTMSRPMAFLRPFIGDKALNALGLPDNSFEEAQQKFIQSKMEVA